MIRFTCTTAMALLAGLACSAEPLDVSPAPEGVDQAEHKHMYRLIQMQTFYSLPEAHRAQIIKTAEERGIELPMNSDDLNVETDASIIERNRPLAEGEGDELYAEVSHAVEREVFDTFSPLHQRMLSNFAVISADREVPALPCFVPGTDRALIDAFEAIVFPAPNPIAFQQTTRWSTTALNPGGSAAQGTPTILTYSFPADGTNVPSGVGEPTAPNDLNAWLDGIYGNRATWRAFYDEIFAGWGELSGNTYVLEPNDDNASLDFQGADSAPGIAGVRGDLRMVGKPIDGNSGTLAYNFFPPRGDMVLDSADNFYNNTQQRSRRLRNILYHEHGHGMGQLHVCPLDNQMLMNPFINLSFDGPQFDDALNAQRFYGDPNEPNDSTATATILGSLSVGQTANVGGTVENGAANKDNVDWVSIDDNNDSDVYEVTLAEDGLLTVVATPLGYTYLDSTQTNNCDTGVNYPTLSFGNLRLRIFDSSGTQLGTANDTSFGFGETLVENLDAGTYFIEVDSAQTTNDEIQAYVLDLDVGTPVPQPLGLTVGVLPTNIAPGVPGVFDVTIDIDGDTIISGPDLVVTNPSGTTTVPLSDLGGGFFLANIPPQLCGDDPTFFIEVESLLGGITRAPETGEFTVVIGSVESIDLVASDSGDNSIGITVGGNITSQAAGQWTAGAPEGNDRDDPPVDFDGNNLAWLTGRTPGNTNSDVDGGFTTIETVDYNFSAGGSVSFAYWAADSVNTLNEATDGLFVDYSIDGGSSWITVRDFGTANQWFTNTITASELGNASAARIRWRAVEDGDGDVFEAAVDAIEITAGVISCENPVTCNSPADVNGDGDITPADFSSWISAFNGQTPQCDQNGDGLCNPQDFSAFILNFNAGCP
ncbi:MAG: GC-type dockerin domain-anchored protein [Planctomycetota bacterium]